MSEKEFKKANTGVKHSLENKTSNPEESFMEDTKQDAENFLRTCPTTEFLCCTTTAVVFTTIEFTYSYVCGGLNTTFKSKLF